MIGKIADKIASSNLNIMDMTNKSRDDLAINLIDLDQIPSEEIIKDIESIEHVLSVRLCAE
jgi:D-3-phosphoglycerate dehydrogenase